jgi:hypothetical protein
MSLVFPRRQRGDVPRRSSRRTGPRFACEHTVWFAAHSHEPTSRFVTDSSALGDLRAVFTALAPRSNHLAASDVAMLQGRVCAAVDEMKAEGALPERIIVAVKRVATDSGVQWADNRLFVQLIAWCVDRYYEKQAGE